MADVATISLRVNTGELEKGNQALDKFQQTADKASKAADGVGKSTDKMAASSEQIKRASDYLEKYNGGIDAYTKSLNRRTMEENKVGEAVKFQNGELEILLSRINPLNKSFGELDKIAEKLSQAKDLKLIDEVVYGRYQAILDSTTDKLYKAEEALTEEGRAKLKNAKTAELLEASQKKLIESLSGQAATFKASKSQIAEYRAAQLGISEQAAPIIASIREQEKAIAREAEQKRIAAIQSRSLKQAIKEMELEERTATAEVNRAARARSDFIQKLKDQVAAQNLSRSELLRYKAEQLGAGSAAEVYIKKLKDSANATHSLGLESAGARREIGILIGEVARGNFGALRGSSITLANRAGWIDQLLTLKGLGIATVIGGISASVYVLGKAFYDADQDAEKLRQSLALTNSFSGLTATSMLKVVDATRASGVTYSDASEALTALVRAGVPAGANFEKLTASAVKFSKETGASLDEVAKSFAEIANDPTKGILALNERYHFLSAAQFKRIQQLQEEGKYTEALAEANRVAADGMDRTASKMKESLGTVSEVMRGLTNMAKGMWDAIEGIGRESSTGDVLKTLTNRRDSLLAQIDNSERTGYNQKNGRLDQWKKDLISVSAQIDALNSKQTAQVESDKAQARAQAIHNQNLKDAIALQDGLNQGLTNREKREKAINELNQQRIRMNKAAEDSKGNVGMSDAEYNKRLANINNQYKDPKTAKGKAYTPPAGVRTEDSVQADLLVLQAQLQTLKEHKSVNDVISQQRKDLWAFQAKITVLQQAQDGPLKRQLSAQEQSLLASSKQTLTLKEQLAVLGDQVTAQEQLNKRMDTAQKYVTQMSEKGEALDSASTISSRMASQKATLAQLRIGWKNSGGSLEDAGYKQQEDAAKRYFAKEEELRGNWQDGIKKGFAEYADEATDVYGQVSRITQGAFSGMSASLTDFLVDGKNSFNDFLKSFLRGIAQMMVQLAMLRTMRGALGGTAVGSFLGFANGGLVPAFDSGGYTGDGGKFEPKGIVHGGEFVFTKAATQALGVSNLYALMRGANGYADGGVVGKAPMASIPSLMPSGGGMVFNSTINVNGQTSQQSSAVNGDGGGQAIKNQIIGLVSQQIDQALGQSGKISNFVNKKIGRR